MIFTRVSRAILRSMRVLVLVFACAMFLFSNALPAMAISSGPSNPSKGEEPLNAIFEESKDITDQPPLSGADTQRKANEGINEVQGSADRERMYTPENSRQAVTAKDQAERALERITGRD